MFIYPVLSMTNQYKSNHMTKTMIGYFQDYAFIELWAPQLQNISLLCNIFKQAGTLVLWHIFGLSQEVPILRMVFLINFLDMEPKMDKKQVT